VIAPALKGADDSMLHYPVQRVSMPFNSAVSQARSFARTMLAARKAVAQLRPKIILCCAALPFGFLCSLRSVSKGTPYAVLVYGNDVLQPKGIKQIMLVRGLKNAAKVIAISNFTADAVAALGVPRGNIAVIPPGIEFNHYEPGKLPGKHVILSVGRLVERKGHDKVIMALPKVLEKVPDARYIIVGDGPHKAVLEKLVHALALDNSVHFAGSVHDDDVAEYYKAADVFIMPSRHVKKEGDVEGFGIVYLEANACAKPVIAGRAGGAVDAVIDGRTGILVDPEEPQEIADALVKLLSDREKAAAMGAAGREHAKQFDWPVIAARVQDLMEGIWRQ
jgi:phosphatidylinositol alpha-1,6-mannosyltransferase